MELKQGDIIYIDGYWIVDPEKEFMGYKCMIGEWDGKEDAKDEDIFYYFENIKNTQDMLYYMNPKNCGGEFVVTKWVKMPKGS